MSGIETWLESIHKRNNRAATEMARGLLDLLTLRNVSYPKSYAIGADYELVFSWSSMSHRVELVIASSGVFYFCYMKLVNTKHGSLDTVKPGGRYPSWFLPLIKSIDEENGK